MNIIKKISSLIKQIFNKKNNKKLLQSKDIYNTNSNFIDSLKFDTNGKTKKKKIEILTCTGDGLGIQREKNNL